MAYFPDLSPYAYGRLTEATPPPNRLVLNMASSFGRWLAARISNGEIRVSREGITFAAPLLIAHYIEEHGYLPPDEFLRAIEEATC